MTYSKFKSLQNVSSCIKNKSISQHRLPVSNQSKTHICVSIYKVEILVNIGSNIMFGHDFPFQDTSKHIFSTLIIKFDWYALTFIYKNQRIRGSSLENITLKNAIHWAQPTKQIPQQKLQKLNTNFLVTLK